MSQTIMSPKDTALARACKNDVLTPHRIGTSIIEYVTPTKVLKDAEF